MSDNDRVPLQPWSTDSGYFIRPEPAKAKAKAEAEAPVPAAQLEDGTWVGYAPSHVPWMEVLHSEALAGNHGNRKKG
jgi:hypothetical protein